MACHSSSPSDVRRPGRRFAPAGTRIRSDVLPLMERAGPIYGFAYAEHQQLCHGESDILLWRSGDSDVRNSWFTTGVLTRVAWKGPPPPGRPTPQNHYGELLRTIRQRMVDVKHLTMDVKHLTIDELEAGLDAIRRAPKDAGVLQLIVRRPQIEAREVLDEGHL